MHGMRSTCRSRMLLSPVKFGLQICPVEISWPSSHQCDQQYHASLYQSSNLCQGIWHKEESVGMKNKAILMQQRMLPTYICTLNSWLAEPVQDDNLILFSTVATFTFWVLHHFNSKGHGRSEVQTSLSAGQVRRILLRQRGKMASIQGPSPSNNSKLYFLCHVHLCTSTGTIYKVNKSHVFSKIIQLIAWVSSKSLFSCCIHYRGTQKNIFLLWHNVN